MLKLFTPNISFPSNLTANFLTTALPKLLTNAFLGSATEDNSMLQDRFAVPGMMTSLVNLAGVVCDNYLLSCSLHASSHPQGTARI